jgi:NAD(P)-dependent dehydrogenase (short-subunit alcohol dehydrogenase family)
MKTVIVTGATSGIGFAVCEALLGAGCRVIGIGRTGERAAEALEKLRRSFLAADCTFFHGDLMLTSDVRRLAAELRQDLDQRCGGRLDALVLNAGCVRSWYMTTPEGFEQQFALNHLSGFLLTSELLPHLTAGRGMVLITSSQSHKMMKVNWNDIFYQKRYRPLMAYKQSKLCNMLFARALNDRYADKGIRAYGIDPGLVHTEIGCKNTGGVVNFVWQRRKKHGVDPSVPARIYAELITRDTRPYGLYFGIRGEAPCSRQVTQENADRLFQVSEKLLNIEFGVHKEEDTACLS